MRKHGLSLLLRVFGADTLASMPEPDFIRQTLEDLRARGLYRRLVALGPSPAVASGEGGSAAGPRVKIGGREVLQFASNNYLGLANDPRVKEAAARAIERWGWGAGASRLVAGHTEAHEALEAELAAFEHTEAALVFPTGYQTNLGVVGSLVGRGDLVLSDRENHASIYDAVKLSGARLVRYVHADAGDAARLLAKHHDAPGRRLLVTDTVFSMDGRLAPLRALALLAEREGAMLVLDEAHATGVLGPTGAGLAEEVGLESGITASVGTLSKALGGIGGFVGASREVCDLIVNRGRSFIYTTALPAAACEAARAALRIVRAEPDRRKRVLALAERLRCALQEKGFDSGRSETQIVPVLVGAPERALALAAALLERGIFCPAIRPPTVPPGTSRLRVSLTAEHTEEDIGRLVSALVAARG
ncbi:MAG: 8-amino-7-oxononanoate synthase [Planctomycetota bacterium]|nr:8-amino-7-oxononanoate synthase [Planctomycetota bacterium]